MSAPTTAAVAAPTPDLPNERVLVHAARIALEKDKPILLDYYAATKTGSAFIGEDGETKEKMLVKGTEEYTSPILKMFKAKDDFIIETENSIYIAAGTVKRKTISMSGM